MDGQKASEIAVIPTGYNTPTRRIPNPFKLPDREDWFNSFWNACVHKMKEKDLALLLLTQYNNSNKLVTVHNHVSVPFYNLKVSSCLFCLLIIILYMQLFFSECTTNS